MRASLRALAVAGLALTTASFAAAAKGGKASEDRKVSDFTGVEVQAGIRAIISIADRRMTVEGDEDSRVLTEVHDGVLDIGWEKSGAGSLPVVRWVAEEETRVIRPSPRPFTGGTSGAGDTVQRVITPRDPSRHVGGRDTPHS